MEGSADISPFGVKSPARFIFVHNAGKDYRYYIEATWFGMPFMRVNESHIDGNSHFELPVGTHENDPSSHRARASGCGRKRSGFPSIFLTDERVHWKAVDENTALLFVPFGEGEENFVVRFDPETGLIDLMEAMRCRDAVPEMHKILWITKNIPGTNMPGSIRTSPGRSSGSRK